jgi:hypothetical protein
MELHPIRTETDYQKALRKIESLFDAAPNTQKCDRLDILSTLVAAYEKANFPIEIPDPIEAIQYYNEKIVRSTRMAIVLSAIVIFVLAMPQFLKLQYLCNFPCNLPSPITAATWELGRWRVPLGSLDFLMLSLLMIY